MMKISLKKTIAAALALLILTAASASAAADTEVQLDTIANADDAWNELLEDLAADDSRYMRFAVHDYPTLDIAVTDLDANGRLEVIFRTSTLSREGVACAENKHSPAEHIRGLKMVEGVPIGLHALMYQVTEDGTGLEQVKIDVQNGDVTSDFPDLTRLQEPQKISTEIPGARLYRIYTTVRRKPEEPDARIQPFRLLYHTIWLTGNTLCARLDVEEDGNYAINSDGTVEGFGNVVRMDGREMPSDAFYASTYYADFRKIPAVHGSVNWIRCKNFRDEDFRANVRSLLAESWYGFSYGLR